MSKLKNQNAKKFLTVAVASALCCTLSLSALLPVFEERENVSAENKNGEISTVSPMTGKVDTHISDYFNTSVVQKLPDTVKKDEEISVIVRMNIDPIVDEFQAAGKTRAAQTVGEFAASGAGKRIAGKIGAAAETLRTRLKKEGLKFELGEEYNVLMSGFEAKMKASEFEDFTAALGNEATAIVGEVYARCETQLVTNDVNVYDTGIFDSSDSKYDGTGTVIAVLDTGLDYTHSAFDPARFDAAGARLTQASIDGLISRTSASQTTLGLTAEDVYINAKVPFAYDYADKDPDVYPMASEHGTHVSGVIVGEDDVITGVATNAQLVSMKVFSDVMDGARDSWLLAALEDCTVLEVDVINMSLGSSAGFSRNEDKTALQEVYDKIQSQGISLIAAASNSFNSTFSSEKNGNLPLTSNPDSATVGSPSTYESTLSVASIKGVKTPYLTYNGSIMYFTESTNKASKPKNFVDEILPEGVNEKEFEYVTIPGVGRSIDYTGLSMAGKIALVRRGSTSFEEKARVALQSGAAGLIVYNNVSGDVSMTVGNIKLAVCSISQTNGETLAAQSSGKIMISRSQTAGPFMSDFSSWGPTPDLHIKPEITAHGGDIYSAVPGQSYDRMSGTSMAAPNQAGVTALVRQYVKETFSDIANDPVAVTNRVNQLMMSTADIAYNVNGLPYSVRKQGAGLANLASSTSSPAYLTTFDKDGNLMDKPKLELGDDPDKAGVYTLKFAVNNFSGGALSYDVGAIVQTEGVSETKTHQGDTTVTEEGYTLSGASVRIVGIKGGTNNGMNVTVGANSSAEITVEIALSDSDKSYLDTSFANGMYVEGYITLKASGGSQNGLSVPYLAFYGDWTQAPIFDKDFYETNRDELDDSIDTLDKNLPDAYATRPVGGLYNDYIGYLGAYPYAPNPTMTPIAADRKYSALTNNEEGINNLYGIFAGMLRGAKRVVTSITDATTGEMIYSEETLNQRKSYSTGLAIVQSTIFEHFKVSDYNLKNNTQYLVKVQAYLDYGDGGVEKNLRNTFEFPFVTDFEAPAVTDCDFYTEYDRTEKKTRLFARLNVYDNHYVAALQIGAVRMGESGYVVDTFDRYLTPVYSDFNTTNVVTYELTDYMDQIKSSYNKRSFVVTALDYAMNQAMYEINIPDSVLGIHFEEEEVKISPNETYDLNPIVTPSQTWVQSLDYISSNESIVRVVNGKIIGIKAGEATITAVENGGGADAKRATLKVRVLGEGEPGYQKFDAPAAEEFTLTGYHVEKAFYLLISDDREIGETDDTITFVGSGARSLSMYPSESVTLNYKLRSYFPNSTSVTFESSNPNIVRVDSRTGTVTAVAEGNASITVQLKMNGLAQRSEYVSVTVKNPYDTSGPYLVHYFGNGGKVVLPAELSLTEIQQYAFSNYEYVPKDENDEISDDDPLMTKPQFIGESTIEEVVIPEGVKAIGNYAFAGLTGLKKITLPSTIESIGLGAFYGCTALADIQGAEYIKFISKDAFYGCNALKTVNFGRIIAIGDSAFEKTFTSDSLKNAPEIEITLPVSAQSIGKRAFAGNANAVSLTIQAAQVKLGDEAFTGCVKLKTASVNAAVIPTGLFSGCSALENVTIGKSVAVIGENAFGGTQVAKFTVTEGNGVYHAQENGAVLLNTDGTQLLAVAPAARKVSVAEMPSLAGVTEIGAAAFSGNGNIVLVDLPSVTRVNEYAFANCTALGTKKNLGTSQNPDIVEGYLKLAPLAYVGDHAFYNTGIDTMPEFSAELKEIGEYSFAQTKVTTVVIPDGFKVGDAAFEDCAQLATVTVKDNVTVGIAAFRSKEILASNSSGAIVMYRFPSKLKTLSIGANADLQPDAFYGVAAEHITLGGGAVIGDGAFYNAQNLKSIDLSQAKSIGFRAFSGMVYRASQTAIKITVCAAKLTEVDLSACESLGAEAFMFCHDIKTVKLGSQIKEVPDYAFFGLLDVDAKGNKIEYALLESVEGLSHIEKIGECAFQSAKFSGSLDLSSASEIKTAAFADCVSLGSVTLKEGAKLGAGVFANCEKLVSVTNLDKVAELGDEAFFYSGLTKADVSSATTLGNRVFIGSKVTEVVLSDNLENIGENPFTGCLIPAFQKTVNGSETDTYDIGENIKVIGGVLYRVVPNGLELVVYPAAMKGGLCKIEEGTVRIGARAFEGSENLTAVEIPASVKAVGHKAFFDCKRLTLVTFNGAEAPILEEEYDVAYQLYVNLPFMGEGINGSTGEKFTALGIVPYRMWNADQSTSTFYYGANFVNYVGKQDQTLVMARPVNGKGYDTFIFNKYFGTVIESPAVLLDDTLAVIELINALPEFITISDKAAVEAASAAFYGLSTDQLALVAEMPYSKNSTMTLREKLTAAESTIDRLESQGTIDPGGEDKPDGDEKPDEKDSNTVLAGVLGGLGAGIGVIAIAFVVCFILYKKKFAVKAATVEDANETEDNTASDRAENADEGKETAKSNGETDVEPDGDTHGETEE